MCYSYNQHAFIYIANGTVYGKSPQFNASLESLSDFVHSQSLKFGVYTDRGTEV